MPYYGIMNPQNLEPVITRDTPTYVVINPFSRTGRESYQEVVRSVAERMNLVGDYLPESPAELVAIIQSGLSHGVTRFLIGGGDGTLSIAAQALLFSRGVLGVLPLGTGNTFAQSLGIRPWPHCLESLISGEPLALDVGQVETKNGSRTFLNSATVGITENLVKLLTPEAKRRLKWGAWAFNVRKALEESDTFHITLEYQGRVESYRTRQLVVAKGRNLAGPIFSTPHAHHHDGKLHVFSLGSHDWWSLIRVAALLLVGRHINDASAHYNAVEEIRVTTDPPRVIDIDGDLWDTTPATFRVQVRALWVITGLPGTKTESSRG
ncbi:MAG: diacylglycerol kinase [Sulfobacillus benefaciens]|uniref:Diacylglycerol kinase n=1 Tax=Sulfobacillus benefaciens TaxID=453960 RepID=A0A2T2XF52_9FIRM|nr:MAG: diacylglycerol kinase [Sulfobacillus benefaciens]